MLKPMLMNTEPTLILKPEVIWPTKSDLRFKRLLSSLILIWLKRDKNKSLPLKLLRINKEPSKLNSKRKMLPGDKKLLDSNLKDKVKLTQLMLKEENKKPLKLLKRELKKKLPPRPPLLIWLLPKLVPRKSSKIKRRSKLKRRLKLRKRLRLTRRLPLLKPTLRLKLLPIFSRQTPRLSKKLNNNRKRSREKVP